jgi:protein TonB
VHCEHCQITAAEGARFCPNCGGKVTPRVAAGAAAADLAADAPTVALIVGPCESCGAPTLPGSTLCLPCTRAFESILGTQSTAPTADMPALGAAYTAVLPAYEAATLLQAQAPALPSAPVAAPSDPPALALAEDEPLADDEEYEEEEDDAAADDLMADEGATVLAVAPEAEPEPAFSASPEWTPAPELNVVDGIVAIAPWARKGPDADEAPEAEDASAAAAPAGAEPLPWWERSGQDGPVAVAKPEVARYVPPPSAALPPSASLESTVARQHMRPKVGQLAAPAGRAGSRNRTLLIAAALAGIAAIGTPVMWKLAFADRRTTVSALTYEPAATAAPTPAPAPRPERTHGTPAPEPPRVYQDLLPAAPEPVAPPPAVTVTAPSAPAASRTPIKPTKKPGQPAAPEPAAPAVATPEPAPLLVAAAPPVVQAPAAAAPAPPAQIHAEAVPLGKLFEISQVDERPQVTSRFEPVLPARLSGAPQPVVVIVRVLISPSGRAAEASSLRNPTNDDGLAAAAVATVRQWTFAPAKKKGQPVSCWYNVGVAFRPAAGN